MSDGIYVALSGAIARSRQLEISANNLSNLETTAYRKRRASFKQVMGTKGAIILPPGPVGINETGHVSSSGKALGQLKLVDFVKAGDLLPQGVNRYKSQVKSIQSGAMVRQGKLESSNVKPLDEMVQLIKIQRSFEAVWQAVQSYREMDSRAVEVGRP